MDKITCPICTRLNDPSDSRCWFCSAELHPDVPSAGSKDDWLSGMSEDLEGGNTILNDEPPPNIEDVTPSEDIPEWLARIRVREAAERAQLSSEEELLKKQKKTLGGIPDWLSSIGEDIEQSITPEESPSVDSGFEVVEQVPPAPESETDIPREGESDWLESLKSWQPVSIQEDVTESEDFSASAEEEVSVTSSIEDESDVDIEGLKKPVFGVGLPVVGEAEETSMGADDRENNVARWFKTVEEKDPTALQGVSNVTPKEYEPEIIDSIALIPTESESKDQISQVFEELTSQVVSEEIVLPDSYEGLIAPEEIEPAPPPVFLESEEPISEVVSIEPMFTSSVEESIIDTPIPSQVITQEDAAEETDSSEPFMPDELPDWLNDKQPVDEPEPEPKPKPAIVRPVLDDKLSKPEKANLPVWLEAMRPIKAVELPAIPSEPITTEKSSDILEALEVVAGGKIPRTPGKPSDLGGGLKVTERQKANASLLSIMAANVEGTIEEDSRTVQVKEHVLWRAFLALVFLVVAILGGTAFIDYGLQPALFPEEVVHTFDQINSLPVDKPVLLAGDFEAGLAGEIRWSSQPLIEHLMRRNLAIALISTNPVDTALLSAQITKGLVAVPNYPVFEKVVDLGYLPGGAIAVQSLNGEFSMAVPLTAELTATSTHPLLNSVNSLKDFGAVIVISDDSENARIWIEQIQPQIAATPLLMVTSAQAAPLIQPYYQSGQIAGLISGMPGSLVYERILQTPGDATGHLSSLQMLSVLMAGLILLGGFVSMVKPVEFGDKQ